MILPREIEAIRAEIKAKVAESGADLLEILYRRQGPAGVITLIVDKVGGVTLEDCVTINRTLGAYFDELPGSLMQGPYTLEVNSPGLDHPLVIERDLERVAGQSLRVTYREISGAVKTRVGKALALRDGMLIFEDEDGGAHMELLLSNVIKAVREIRFNRN